ncbi:MAG: N-acyl-D-amino-acid deacylase family protein [Acidimicrobiales bacterium]
MSQHDLVIRQGTVIDGSGADRFVADVAVSDGVITEVGEVTGRGRREIDADGRIVQPGFVDIHTHYDGQATWDAQLAPSSWHGVTTVVMGNCGVGFAPVRPSDHERLIQLMEGVEDIPGIALHEGLPWSWQSFEEYLDYLDTRQRDIDLGAQLPHAAVRLNVMGERAMTQEPATPDDIAQMAEIARRAIAAGAVGFTTSRTLNHKSSLGEPTPTLKAEFDELVGIAEAVGTTGKGVLQVVTDFIDFDAEFGLARAMAERSGRPVSISVAQAKAKPDLWKQVLDAMSEATAAGVTMRAQVGARPIGLLMGNECTLSPFMGCPTYDALRARPRSELVAELRRPEVRAAILAERDQPTSSFVLGSRLIDKFHVMYALGDPPCYEPEPDTDLAAEARRRGVPAEELVYDMLAEGDGTALIYVPSLNFVDGNLDVVREMLVHPASVPGLSDGGAHVGTICDVSFPTTLLQWWGRDRPEGRIPLETVIHKQARATAQAVGFDDRGLIAPGYKADLNVVDLDGLTLHRPVIVHDLPAGGRRLLQRVDGYDHTFVSGVEVAANSESTGATPGRLVRGQQTIG